MAENNDIQPMEGTHFEKTVEALKEAYSYLHPDYRIRKLLQLIFIVPMMFIIYGVIYGLLLMEITGTNNDTMPVYIKGIDMFLIIVSTIVSAYFYPFSVWWYKRSVIGNLLNNICYAGAFWVVILKVIGTLIGGIAIAGTLAPIMGPLTLRKCKKKNLIIGETDDFL